MRSTSILLLLGCASASPPARPTAVVQPAVSEAVCTRPLTLASLDRSDIDRLAIRTEGGSVELRRQDETWSIVSPLVAQPDAAAVQTAIAKLTEWEVGDVITTAREDHQRLGVAADATHVTVGAAECSLQFAIGGYEAGATAVRVIPGNEVVGIEGAIRFAFNKPLRDWRDRRVVDVDPSELRALRFRPNVAFERRDGSWVPTGDAGAGPFDWVEQTARSLARMRAVNFAAPDVDEQAAGLLNPTATVVVEFASQTVTLQRGATLSDGSVYLRRVGRDLIYVVSPYLAARMDPGAPAPASPSATPSGNQNIPPEIMQQVREQLEAQQGRATD